MRTLFTTTGHSGHLLPLVPLALAADRAGHEVVFATHGSRAAAVERLGFPVHRLGEAPDEAWAPFMEKLPTLGQADADAHAIAGGFAGIGAAAALPSMLETIERVRPDLLVHESYEFAGPIAADRHGVPVARVALGLASTEDWVTRLAGVAVDDLRDAHGLPAAKRSRPLFSAVPPGLDDGPAHRYRGPRPAAAPPLPAWWENAEDPLVYLTFGSVSGSLPFFPALYGSALDALATLPVRVLLTVGRDADLSSLGPLPANAHVEPWVAQDEILPHAAAVVSHGGFGTTLGALGHGVPLVLLPLFAGDQWRNARRVAALGAGIHLGGAARLVFDPPGPELIAALPAAVASAVQDAGLRREAMRLGAEMHALPPADAAVGALEAASLVPAG